MGWNPFKAAKKVATKVAKPFRKIGQKFIPKELRWAAPYLAAATPFMLPAGGFGASGLFSSAAGRAALSSLANVAGQAVADPEGEDINLLSTLLAGGTGALSTPGMGETLRGGIETTGNTGFFQGAENLGREALAQGADYLGGAAEGLASLGSNPEALFKYDAANKINKLPGLAEAAKNIAPLITQGTGDLAKASGDKALREFEAADAAEQAEIEATTTANEGERASLQMTFMRQAGHDEETIQETLEMNGLGEYYEPPGAAQGGRIGYAGGQLVSPKADGSRPGYRGERILMKEDWKGPPPNIVDFFHQTGPLVGDRKEILEGFTKEDWENLEDQGGGIFDILIDILKTPYIIRGGDDPDWFNKRDGGIIGLKHGGMLNLGGNEMDYRGGGFVPIGKKERADDVPARLSKNEFVMTADAVRAAGGGSVNKGAQRMYNVMNNLEARA
jgi:hypothetical protein